MNKENSIALGEVINRYSPNGLTNKEADKLLEKQGANNLSPDKFSPLKLLFKQLINPLSFILLFAASLSIFMNEITDSIIILIIVLLNTILSFIQEYRSNKAVEKLSTLIERKIVVIRNGEPILLDTRKLVVGDTIILKTGDIVPADLKIMESLNLSVNESQLTGESYPIDKISESTDINLTLLYTGSIIENGNCKCVVYATGKDTELGKIAKLSKDTKKNTPYQKSLTDFSNSILKIIGGTVILMLIIKGVSIHNINNFADVVIFAIALAMTVIPEALPVITTITLSSGSLQLAKQNVIAKRLSAIEDLGRINILCTDKTGTLTEDKLTVIDVISHDKDLFNTLAYASLESYNTKNSHHINSFDSAFSEYLSKTITFNSTTWTQLATIPFNPSTRRRRVIINNNIENKTYLVVIGAPDTLLELSTPNITLDYYNIMKECGKYGIRQLAIAYKEINYNETFDITKNETDLIFLGFAKLTDPLRKTAKNTIKEAKDLGINVKILSGDTVEVASFIGKQVNLLNDNDKVYTGDELFNMSDVEFNEIVHKHSVFAKVTPEQKYNIIKHLKVNNTVGYQGDGINDAPSLKVSDVAIAVHNATDVAKESSDIVLLEDDLNVIINGVKYGRSIFVNINKYIKHAMIGNLGNFFSMIVFFLGFAADVPMLAIQLLIGNIIQDLPLMTVFSDSVNPDEIATPKVSSEINSVIKTSISLGLFTALYYLIFFLYVGTSPTPLTQTTLFLFYNFTQLLIVISVRSEKHFLWKGSKPSLLMLSAIGFFILLSLGLTYIPCIASFMGFVPLPAIKLFTLICISIAYIVLLDIVKVSINKSHEILAKIIK